MDTEANRADLAVLVVHKEDTEDPVVNITVADIKEVDLADRADTKEEEDSVASTTTEADTKEVDLEDQAAIKVEVDLAGQVVNTMAEEDLEEREVDTVVVDEEDMVDFKF